MKTVKLLSPFLFVATVLFFSACDRSNASKVDAKEIQHSEDLDRVVSESNQVVSDAETVLSETSVGRTTGVAGTLCGATVDTSLISQKTITVTYDGATACNGYIRSGTLRLKLVSGSNWKDAGAKLEITHTNYKVTRTTDNKSVVFNGVKYVTNVSGHLTLNRQYKERGNDLKLKFDDGSEHNWSLARNWSVAITNLSPVSITYTITGDSTIGGTTNAMAWGTNRYGTNFTNSTPTAIVTGIGGSGCGFTRPSAGVHVHELSGRGKLTTTLGVDANGIPQTAGCAYGFKLNWEGTNGTKAEVVRPYK